MLTLRQIEVIRAIVVTGTIADAAKLLNVSAPGISRLMKYSESSIGVRPFDRQHGRLVPTPEARKILQLPDIIYGKVEDLRTAIDAMGRGVGQELRLASVPSIAIVMMPLAVERAMSPIETMWRCPSMLNPSSKACARKCAGRPEHDRASVLRRRTE